MKAIQIAPTWDEIVVTDYTVSTTFAGGIVYSSTDFVRVRPAFSDLEIKQAFSTFIALCSKRWQVEDCMNRYFNIKGILL